MPGKLRYGGGICHLCGMKIGWRAWDVIDEIPLAAGGDDTPENREACAPQVRHRAWTGKTTQISIDRQDEGLGIVRTSAREVRTGTRLLEAWNRVRLEVQSLHIPPRRAKPARQANDATSVNPVKGKCN